MPTTKKYLVESSAVTSGLADLDISTTPKTMRMIEVKGDDILEADDITSNYNQDYYVASTSASGVSGQTTDIIVLPKEVVG